MGSAIENKKNIKDLPKYKKPKRNLPVRLPKQSRIPKDVLLKLILFTILMFTLPFIVYYYTLDRFFIGNTTYAALAAAFTANLVIAAYVVVAIVEDRGDDDDNTETNNKTE
ncbi:hypothetical protein BCR32DRAFT_290812 [Anaeromyces robustus]|uniref:Vacuolar ATPase assembly integral membrane protein VMA21 n=1 Tax=Anaeromyces robustus TaxID=1754192 RepID=A0A1Y1XHN7_9FUNG|nr:hypothetical protein BCR32DRAFT_290812 [Anaeromyces robustus]|eukprot:ORX85257.1 hypothetical protein BCR32DRAFT_290812 [Anaeromyces robustus]